MPRGLILSSAMWCRYCYGVDEKGQEIAPNDPNWDALKAAAHRAKADPIEWLKQREIYGDLGANRAFVEAFAEALDLIWSQGAEAAMRAYLAA
jgi:mannitol 2-dehydrogenase